MKKIFARIIYRTIGNLPLPGCGMIRRLCAKYMFSHCGKNCTICRGAHFSSNISLGDYSGIGENAFLQGTIYIGDDVMMARDVKIYTTNHCTSDISIPMRCQGTTDERPVYIADDVWIGSNVIILPGVHVGHGAVLGAGCVVRKDVPEYAVMIGNPAQILKYRNSAHSTQ